MTVFAQLPAQELFRLPAGVETRWASPENPKGERGAGGQENAGRKGRPAVPVKAGASLTLAEVTGSSGTVRRIWATLSDRSPQMLRSLKLEMFWDGAATPAVSAPFGDFFGAGLGRVVPFQSALFASPEGRSFNCYVPMPFRKGMRIVLTNESGKDLEAIFYDVDYTLGDPHGDDVLYFHAIWRRQRPTELQKDFEVLPKITGRGRYLGANFSVMADQKTYQKTWWGEGEVKVYLDGDAALPTLNGTGTEDYIGTGYGQGAYSHLYQGCPVADQEHMRFSFYRLHVPDPVYFRREARVTIQQIGWRGADAVGAMRKTGQTIYKAGPGLVVKPEWEENLFERRDDWAATAYFYLDRAENGLPRLAPASERAAGFE